VTFKDLKKKVSLELALQQSKLFGGLDNKPFWIWNIEEHEKRMSKQKDIAASIILLVYLTIIS
jgi:hypothetical protein